MGRLIGYARVSTADQDLGSTKKCGAIRQHAVQFHPELSPAFSPGYHCSNFPLSVPSRVRVRACSMRCGAGFDHCIC